MNVFLSNSMPIISNALQKVMTPHWMLPSALFLIFGLWVRKPLQAGASYSAPPRQLGDAWLNGVIRMLVVPWAMGLDVRELCDHLDVTGSVN